MAVLHTTLGPRRAEELGLVLPHEHLLVDFRPPDAQPVDAVRADAVVVRMAPLLREAGEAGVTALVECTPHGLGRRADVLAAVSRAAGVPVVVATGVYREPWVPGWVHAASDAEVEAFLVGELTEGVDGTGVVAGFIKVSAGDDGLTPVEERVLRAAARAAVRTGALVGSHTVDGRVVLAQLDVVVEEGLSPDRFLSIHTQLITDAGLRQAVVDRGAWIEYDHVGQGDDGAALDLVLDSLAAGHGRQLLVSHDAGWFDPAEPGGGSQRPFTTLPTAFLPALAAAGAGEEALAQLTRHNPFAAFAR
ncbi:phosphotriesterase family protein [Quadrisphaera setariae]|uniref:Esterase n=1 Tax=Quadrisphaera setariae TaxID=2593304 RepID=A0A5C8ZKB4_9ACTN|nr:esterase [Quadrisphaera setariae]TXR57290.1 esterase [Quadrisphaera setariae]